MNRLARFVGVLLVFGVLVVLLALVGCSARPLPQPVVAPQSRTIFYQGAGSNNALYSICDKGDRIRFNSLGAFAVSTGACPNGEP